ncbi:MULTISPECIES: DUF397 domain-containing protein [Actinomadura]|uniref:DUF397 domain-containing protein n=1 Tax=Actinomadura litoris TaxID=2678616 RepID=A0A7K1L207_9ACTN|nr:MULTISPECIES: DUF397 domain-containing protein [Actinomadura]MBT2206606.1 DUF397 domain-containing protein [Actinomadura sp. NEAU-AAG7]MUN38295.1 DUF397 domain-containing protein [Actinomadura litoris]
MVASDVRWCKSSRSSGQGGDCVEVGQWRKSSRSGGQGGDCVELADTTSAILVRDSKDPNGPRLALAPAAWRVFAQHVKADVFDLWG